MRTVHPIRQPCSRCSARHTVSRGSAHPGSLGSYHTRGGAVANDPHIRWRASCALLLLSERGTIPPHCMSPYPPQLASKRAHARPRLSWALHSDIEHSQEGHRHPDTGAESVHRVCACSLLTSPVGPNVGDDASSSLRPPRRQPGTLPPTLHTHASDSSVESGGVASWGPNQQPTTVCVSWNRRRGA